MKKKTKVAVAGLATVALVGGTFAIWQATTTINNPFSTNAYSADTVEKFNPADGDDWQPGAKVDKEVGAVNTGDYPVYVRMKLNETWSRDSQTFVNINSGDGAISPQNNVSDKIMNVFQGVPDDGIASNTVDDTVVHKNGFDSNNWILGEDGYYYYKDILDPDEVTESLITSVTLDKNADMGQYVKNETVYWITCDEEYIGLTVRQALDSQYDGNYLTYDDIATLEDLGSIEGIVTGDEKETIKNYVSYLEKTTEKEYAVFTKDGQSLGNNKGYADADYVLTIKAEFAQVNENGWTLPDGVETRQ